MNGCIDNEIILNKKIRPLVFIYIMVVIISSLSLIIIFMLFHYKIYYFFKGNIIMEEDNYYLKLYPFVAAIFQVPIHHHCLEMQ